MGYVVRMPQLGMTMEEGIVAEWAIDEHDTVAAGELVAIVESEKTTNDLEAREDGVLREQLVGLDQPVPPGTPIGFIGAENDPIPDDVYDEAESAKASRPTTDTIEPEMSSVSSTSISREGRVSPRARSYADTHDIDPGILANLDGSGPGGAVIERDVMSARESGTLDQVHAAVFTVAEERSMVGLRGAVADRMTRAASVPQVTLNRSAQIDTLLTIKSKLESEHGLDVSIEDFVVAASARALDAHPSFNGTFEQGVHRIAEDVDVGIAVDVDRGLLTPVLRQVDGLALSEIASSRRDLVSRVLAGDYAEEDLMGGTFTITNLGHFSVESFDPLINVPQVAILGVGTITTDGEQMKSLGLSLTFDHRPNDGADAARFLDTIVDLLEDPSSLLDTPKAALSPDPEPLEGDRRARATSHSGMQAEVQSRSFTWSADEPEDTGGDNTAPTPVEQFLGSLAACLSLTIRIIASRRDVPLDEVTVNVSGSPDEGAIEAIDVEVDIRSSADEETLERVVETAERACYVSRVISEEIERSLRLTVESS